VALIVQYLFGMRCHWFVCMFVHQSTDNTVKINVKTDRETDRIKHKYKQFTIPHTVGNLQQSEYRERLSKISKKNNTVQQILADILSFICSLFLSHDAEIKTDS